MEADDGPGADCHQILPATSSGIWLSSSPLKANLPLVMIQMTTIFFVSKGLHMILRRFNQPVIVSQILTGIILGPCVLGRLEFFSRKIYSPSRTIQLRTLGAMSLGYFMFIIGVKTDLSLLRKTCKRALVIGFIGQATAFIPVLCAQIILRRLMPSDLADMHVLARNVFYVWSSSSFLVVCSLVDEINLLNSKVGRLAISTSLLYDMLHFIVDRILRSVLIGNNVQSQLLGLGSFVSFSMLITFIVLIARPITLWLVNITPKGELLDEAYFATVIVLSLACGLASEIVGHGIEVGMLALGLALPSGPPLGSSLAQKLEGIVMTLGIPVFVANVGLGLEVVSTKDRSWAYMVFFPLLSFVGKVFGTTMPALYCGLSLRDALALALILASKGIFELKMIDHWQNEKLLNSQYLTVLTFYVAGLVAATTPLIRFLYDPSKHYKTDKKRCIQGTKPHMELRLLACVHHENNVGSIMHILEAMHADGSPICVYVLHLVQLVGQAASMLVPYKQKRHGEQGGGGGGGGGHGGSSALLDSSSAIMNVFGNFERRNQGSVSNQPFVSFSPFATMHEEICNLALEKNVSLIILPFQTGTKIDGKLESPNDATRAVDANVLAYAPCSVGILVHGCTGGGQLACPIPRSVVVYFLGGPDDREAVSIAMRIAEERISITVVRFLPNHESPKPNHDSGDDDDPEKKLDDEMIEEFITNYVNGVRVTYQEEMVADTEAMISVIRSMSTNFSMLIVGRGEGRESVLTEGLSLWSEYPELGLIGDMLATTDFATETLALVVQQQRSEGALDGEGED